MDNPRRLRRIEKHSRHEPERPFIALPLTLIGGVAFNALSITAVRNLLSPHCRAPDPQRQGEREAEGFVSATR